MAESLELEIATPERQMVREQVSDVQIPGKDGYLGILPGHAALLGLLGAGALSYSVGGGPRRYLAIDGGFLEVLDDHVRVLADSAERAEDINVERAKSDLQKAQAQLGSTAPDADPAVALAAVNRAQARIDAAEHR
jgi:F-type H+-transporting ATPase subunit epsilon